MQRVFSVRSCKFLRRFLYTGRVRFQDVDLKKNLLYGGDLKVKPSEDSVGSILFNKLKDKNRANKVIQVCAQTGKEMTTLEFLTKSVAVANGLRDRNINVGDFVLVIGNNSLSMNVTLMGVLFVGAVPVPVSSYVSSDDLRHILKYVKPLLYFCDEQVLFTVIRITSELNGKFEIDKLFLLNDTKNPSSQFLYLSDFVEGQNGDWETFTPGDIQNADEEIAIVMKAVVEGAGSRGVGLTHKNINHIFARYESLYSTEAVASDVILMVQKIIWMSGIYSLFLTCYYGAKVVVVGEFDEEIVLRAIENYKVTMCFLYPAKIWQLYKYRYEGKYDLSKCRIYGIGARLQRVLIQGMKERTGLTVKPAYGITEMSGIILDAEIGHKDGSIGKLVPECYAKVVSMQTHQRLPPNTPGEMCFKGPMMMKGYVNDEKATRAAVDKEGFIYSGDYGYYDEEGYFFIVDRIKQVIRYQTHKLSPQEIEGIIKTMESVRDCVVGGIPHAADGYRAIAFVVLNSGSTTSAQEIVDHVTNRLPEHKHLKGGVVFIPKVPRSKESGAIKRHSINKILAKYNLLDEKRNVPEGEQLTEKDATKLTDGVTKSAGDDPSKGSDHKP